LSSANFEQLLAQMQAYGLPKPKLPLRFGQWVRYGPKNKCFYRLREFHAQDGRVFLAGHFGIWGAVDAVKVEIDFAGLSAADRAALLQQQREQEERDKKDKAEKAAKAANRARRQWSAAMPLDKAREVGTSIPYAAAKGIELEVCRIMEDGTIAVPIMRYDAEENGARLVGLQKILPGGKKRFNTGMAMEGGACRIGDTPRDGDVLLLTEGYATGLSIRMATSRTLVVFLAFNAGNLKEVALILRAKYPNSPIVICADDDWKTEQPPGTPFNAGVYYARIAVKSAGRAGILVPLFRAEGREDKWSDFNDVHAAYGLEALREQLRAITTTVEQQCISPAQEPANGLARDDAPPDDVFGPPADYAPPDDVGKSNNEDKLPRGFELAEHGLLFAPVDADGNKKHPTWVCKPLRVVAYVSGLDGAGWGKLIQFSTPDGQPKQCVLSSEMLQGDGSEFRKELAHQGLEISTKPAARQLLSQYIGSSRPAEFAICTDRTGWHGRVFVLPTRTFGREGDKRVVFQADGHTQNAYRERGALAAWQKNISALCVGNSRLAFAVSAAFAALILEIVGAESGGFHFYGGSSLGKTTLLRVAASVFGGQDYVLRWRASDNGLEAAAKQSSGALLCLDELAQMQPNAAGESAYMLANGQGKARANRSGGARPAARWNLLFLSTGEVTLEEHLAEAHRRVTAGQLVRMIDIPIDAGEDLGAYDELRGFETAAALSRALNERTHDYHGTAAPRFISAVIDAYDEIGPRFDAVRRTFEQSFIPKKAEDQVQRASSRFALVAAGGEIATALGITGWPEGEAMRAVSRCFAAWIAARGGAGNRERVERLRRVKLYLLQNGDSQFTPVDQATNEKDPRVIGRVGWRKAGNGAIGQAYDMVYLIPSETFASIVCKGMDHHQAARELHAAGCLIRGPEPRREYSIPVRIPGHDTVRCYHVTSSIFELDI
jgi:putative DNA primase/helicase